MYNIKLIFFYSLRPFFFFLSAAVLIEFKVKCEADRRSSEPLYIQKEKEVVQMFIFNL